MLLLFSYVFIWGWETKMIHALRIKESYLRIKHQVQWIVLQILTIALTTVLNTVLHIVINTCASIFKTGYYFSTYLLLSVLCNLMLMTSINL